MSGLTVVFETVVKPGVVCAKKASDGAVPRGRDILAACGQLRSESVKVRASAS